jgi:hypothetical protein
MNKCKMEFSHLWYFPGSKKIMLIEMYYSSHPYENQSQKGNGLKFNQYLPSSVKIINGFLFMP